MNDYQDSPSEIDARGVIEPPGDTPIEPIDFAEGSRPGIRADSLVDVVLEAMLDDAFDATNDGVDPEHCTVEVCDGVGASPAPLSQPMLWSGDEAIVADVVHIDVSRRHIAPWIVDPQFAAVDVWTADPSPLDEPRVDHGIRRDEGRPIAWTVDPQFDEATPLVDEPCIEALEFADGSRPHIGVAYIFDSPFADDAKSDETPLADARLLAGVLASWSLLRRS